MVAIRTPSAGPRRSFWKRRLGDPLVALLTQGVTPDKVAATLAIGFACSVFPFLGFTSLLNLGVGLALRMNQPILLTLNYLLSPLQLVMIFVYVRLGELLWHAQAEPFTVRELIATARHAGFREFFQRFGWAGIHAFTAWSLSVPLLVGALYFSLRPLLRACGRRHPASAT